MERANHHQPVAQLSFSSALPTRGAAVNQRATQAKSLRKSQLHSRMDHLGGRLSFPSCRHSCPARLVSQTSDRPCDHVCASPPPAVRHCTYVTREAQTSGWAGDRRDSRWRDSCFACLAQPALRWHPSLPYLRHTKLMHTYCHSRRPRLLVTARAYTHTYYPYTWLLTADRVAISPSKHQRIR